MKKLMIAIALTIALPAAAFAQAATPPSAPAANAHAGRTMQGMNMQSCKDMHAQMPASHSKS
jgi:hypothetical protein